MQHFIKIEECIAW